MTIDIIIVPVVIAPPTPSQSPPLPLLSCSTIHNSSYMTTVYNNIILIDITIITLRTIDIHDTIGNCYN